MTTIVRIGLAAAALGAATPAFAIDAKQRVEDKAITAEAVWAAIGDFCGIAAWHPAVAACDLSEKDGAKIRTLTLKDGGGTIVEELVKWDEAAHAYTYLILEPGPLPVANYTSTLSTKADDDGGAGIRWVGSFNAKGASDDEAKAAVEGVYKAGVEALLAKVKGGAS